VWLALLETATAQPLLAACDVGATGEWRLEWQDASHPLTVLGPSDT
jgi:hypothetical protein